MAMKTGTQNHTLTFIVMSTMLLLALLVVTQSAFAQSENGLEKSAMHRSNVSKVVQELLEIADEDASIGEEVRAVAQEQNTLKDEVADAVEKVEKRGRFKTLLFGSDYKNLGKLRSAMVTTDNHLNRLNKAMERSKDPEAQAGLQEQISALEAEQANVESVIADNEDAFSFLGWFVRLFQ